MHFSTAPGSSGPVISKLTDTPAPIYAHAGARRQMVGDTFTLGDSTVERARRPVSGQRPRIGRPEETSEEAAERVVQWNPVAGVRFHLQLMQQPLPCPFGLERSVHIKACYPKDQRLQCMHIGGPCPHRGGPSHCAACSTERVHEIVAFHPGTCHVNNPRTSPELPSWLYYLLPLGPSIRCLLYLCWSYRHMASRANELTYSYLTNPVQLSLSTKQQRM
ncbi:hypothetical protein N7510_006205 [Penicillium lagena]|uniref:uncharacterized protein n=1 Tax=Penicillium lagena TaxID=94218 RepID=UPI0025419E9B|nr:uncharacterized protein N7510_006205 [Penicillium lagena]KAJ5613011.1 hypothetical protein N7510_006205 [Penicillium lagena]